MRSRNAKNLFADDLLIRQAQIPADDERDVEEPTTSTTRNNKRSLSVLFCEDVGATTDDILTALLEASHEKVVTNQSLREQLLGDGEHSDNDSRCKLIERAFQEAVSNGYVTVETTTEANDGDILSLTSKGKQNARIIAHAKIIPDASRHDMLRRVKARIQSRADNSLTCTKDDGMRDAVNKLVQPVAEYCEDCFFRDAITLDACLVLATYLSEETLDVRLHDAAFSLKTTPQQPTSASIATVSISTGGIRSPFGSPPLHSQEQHSHQGGFHPSFFSPLTASPASPAAVAAEALTILAKPQSGTGRTQSSGLQPDISDYLTALLTPDHPPSYRSSRLHHRNVSTGHGNNSSSSSSSSSSHIEEIYAAAAEKWEVLVGSLAGTSTVPIGETAATAVVGTMIDDGEKEGGK